MSMTFEEWWQQGVDLGFAGEGYCETHDGTPWSDEESQLFDAGEDPCVPALRVYPTGRVLVETQITEQLVDLRVIS
jgi:hypothetical protein